MTANLNLNIAFNLVLTILSLIVSTLESRKEMKHRSIRHYFSHEVKGKTCVDRTIAMMQSAVGGATFGYSVLHIFT